MEVAEWKQELGRRLRAARENAGLRQADVAERTGLRVRTLYNLERGNFKEIPHSFAVVCQTLGVNGDDLTQGLPEGRPEVPEASPEEVEQLRSALAHMPKEVRWAMLALGGWLSRMTPERREAEIDRIFRYTTDGHEE